MVRAEGSCPRGRGFKSRRILDGCKRIASYYIKEKLKIKVAKWGTPKKKILKKLPSRCVLNVINRLAGFGTNCLSYTSK